MAERKDPEYLQALRSAMDRLAVRDRFSGDIRSFLEAKGADSDTIDDVLVYLKRRGFLNDQRAAENLMEQATGKNAKGKAKLAEAMEKLGADPETIEVALEVRGTEQELEVAVGLLHLKRYAPHERAKAGRLLISRGFDEDVVEAALGRVLGDVD